MKYSEWSIRDLEDGSCIFSQTNINEDNLLNYLFTIQQFILEIGMLNFWGILNKSSTMYNVNTLNIAKTTCLYILLFSI